MKTQQDRHLEAPVEANRDKHINFLAQENGDVDPADDEIEEEEDDDIDVDEDDTANDTDDDEDADTFDVNGDDDLDEDDDLEEEKNSDTEDDTDDEITPEDDNGFFTDDDNELETEKEKEDEDGTSIKSEKVQPLEPDTHTTTLGDKITVNSNNEDLLTAVTDDNDSSFINENKSY